MTVFDDASALVDQSLILVIPTVTNIRKGTVVLQLVLVTDCRKHHPEVNNENIELRPLLMRSVGIYVYCPIPQSTREFSTVFYRKLCINPSSLDTIADPRLISTLFVLNELKRFQGRKNNFHKRKSDLWGKRTKEDFSNPLITRSIIC